MPPLFRAKNLHGRKAKRKTASDFDLTERLLTTKRSPKGFKIYTQSTFLFNYFQWEEGVRGPFIRFPPFLGVIRGLRAFGRLSAFRRDWSWAQFFYSHWALSFGSSPDRSFYDEIDNPWILLIFSDTLSYEMRANISARSTQSQKLASQYF